jgi:hypothetical protein
MTINQRLGNMKDKFNMLITKEINKEALAFKKHLHQNNYNILLLFYPKELNA